MVTMFDGCNPAELPKAPQMVAGYLDGPCRWPGEGWSRWPNAVKVRISIEANVLADVFDWENGTALLPQVADAVRTRAAAFLPSVVYCPLSRWDVAKSQLAGLPVAWWVADWTGNAHLVPGSVATQWGSFPDYDISLVADPWPKAA